MKIIILVSTIVATITLCKGQKVYIPGWVKKRIQAHALDPATPEPTLVKYDIKALDHSLNKAEQVKYRKQFISAKLIGAKNLTILHLGFSGKSECVAGHFECEFPNSKERFKVWVAFQNVASAKDPLKRVKEIVTSDTWKGIPSVGSGKGRYVIGQVINEKNKFLNGKEDVYITNNCLLSLNKEQETVIHDLPIFSSIKEKGVNGLYHGWVSFSKNYLISTVETRIPSVYGTKVTDVRYMFYNTSTGKELLFPLVFDIDELAKEKTVKSSSGKEHRIVTEVLERPINLIKLKDGSVSLKMFLPKGENYPAGEYLVTPKF